MVITTEISGEYYLILLQTGTRILGKDRFWKIGIIWAARDGWGLLGFSGERNDMGKRLGDFDDQQRVWWRKQWQPTPVLLPGKSHGGRRLVGCSPWGRAESDWATSLSLFTFMHRRRKWQPTPVFLPGESQGQRSLVGCCLWGRAESDTTEVT